MKILIDNKPDMVNLKDDDGCTPLFHVVEEDGRNLNFKNKCTENAYLIHCLLVKRFCKFGKLSDWQGS